MCVDQSGTVTLIEDGSDPKTVFRLHPVMEVRLGQKYFQGNIHKQNVILKCFLLFYFLC